MIIKRIGSRRYNLPLGLKIFELLKTARSIDLAGSHPAVYHQIPYSHELSPRISPQ